MTVYRKWYCTCTGEPIELTYDEIMEDEPVMPVCEFCGASPSSDPKKTIIFRDEENWDD